MRLEITTVEDAVNHVRRFIEDGGVITVLADFPQPNALEDSTDAEPDFIVAPKGS